MNFKTIILGATTLINSTIAFAAYDTGKIIEVYAHPAGQMAVRLDGGVPNARAQNTCGHAGNAFSQNAGVGAADSSSIKSAILAAKASNSTVTLITFGNCIGEWVKIEAMTVN